VQNVLEYLSLCSIIRDEIAKDNDLIELHKTRIKEREYFDSSFNILTQDIIYAAVNYVDRLSLNEKQESAIKRLVQVEKNILPKSDKITLKGTFTNYIENEREKTRIGTLGELLVLQYEQERLKSLKIKKIPEHKSKSEGDGLGYDILSYDKNGNEIFIEVKTTTNGANTPFYITRNELEKSKQENDRYFLYRLYDFDEKNNKSKFFKQKGNLTELCINPILYKAVIIDYEENTIG